MKKALGVSLAFAAVFCAAVASGKPVDQSVTSFRPEIPANPERAVTATGKGMALAPAVCPAPDTVEYGGTFWAADSLRWEAIRDSMWTFESGVGSAFGSTGPNKPAGYHTLMEGWSGIDQTLNPLPYFRRATTCAITGFWSLWAGVTLPEAQLLCFSDGQGYGNGWNLEVRKTFAYGGSGNATLSYQYHNESEDGWDYSYVLIDTTGTGGADDVQLASYTGIASGSNSVTLTRGSSLPTVAGNVIIKLVFQSDGSYSDQDGLNGTTCGGVVFDNIQLTGALVDFTDFESSSNGWAQTVPVTGVGDYSNLVNRNTDLPAPLTFCACGVKDSVLVFYDELGGHPLDQDNIVASPIIDLKAGGDAGRPGKLIIYDVYAEMPLANYVFVQIRARWYPSICAATGLIINSGWRDNNTVYYFGEAPFCVPPGAARILNYSGVIATSAEQLQLGVGAVNLCVGDPFGTPCTGVTNTTPWLDNIRLGVFGSAAAPNLTIGTFDFFQDNFATDGSLNPGATARLDANTLKNASTPGPGSVLRDTLVARGDGQNTEVRLVFHVRPGPFTNAAALASRAALWTAEPGLGAGWYSARMDTAEQAGAKPASLTWMTCFHESDPAFATIGGNDRTPDPTDPSHASNKDIIPDNLFTPGSRIDYFVAARYLPGDPRNPGGTCQWYVVPDTTGGRYKEVEILPTSMAADSSWNCTLYVDHHSDRSAFDHTIEEAGLTGSLGLGSNNTEGTRYDRFDNETPSSGQLSFGRPVQTVFGASIVQTFAYKNIAWHVGTLSSVDLTDEDANMLGPWLTLRGIGNNRFWGSGSGLATSMNASGEPSTVNFMKAILGATRTCNTLRDINCPTGSTLDSTFCVPTSAVAGSEFATTVGINVRGNGCPDLESFDVINRNTSVATSKGQLNYVKNGAAVTFASVTNHNTLDVDYKTVLDGFAVGRARSTPADPHKAVLCTVTTAGVTRTDNVLDWFASTVTGCKLPAAIVDVPDPGTVKPPQFRAALGNAYPNPMNSMTTRIQFTNGSDNGRVTLQIFDVTGRLVKTLVDSKLTAGVHEATWDGTLESGSSAPSGMYFYKMTGDNGRFVSSKKLVMMK